jgi:hypothetical protein
LQQQKNSERYFLAVRAEKVRVESFIGQKLSVSVETAFLNGVERDQCGVSLIEKATVLLELA